MTRPLAPREAREAAQADPRAALLALIAEYRDQRCRELREAAERQARALLAEAHRAARDRVHAALEQARRDADHRLAAAEAAFDTREREQLLALAAHTLRRAWPRLQAALRRRWLDAEARRDWIQAALDDALRLLPGREWQLAHPPDWNRAEASAWLQAHPEVGISAWQAADDCAAGLRICAASACLDASLEGLLADRAVIESRLLDQVERCRGTGDAQSPGSGDGGG